MTERPDWAMYVGIPLRQLNQAQESLQAQHS